MTERDFIRCFKACGEECRRREESNSDLPCDGCYFADTMFCRSVTLGEVEETAEETIEFVDKWSKENPVKTYAQDFFQKFPNAQKNTRDTPVICRNCVYYNGKSCRKNTKDVAKCISCWNEEIPE